MFGSPKKGRMPLIQPYDLIVVVGCAGKIGSSLVNIFMSYGVKVIGIDVVSASSKMDQYHQCENFTYVQLQENYEKLLKKLDLLSAERGVGIINCAYPRASGYGSRPENMSYFDFGKSVGLKLSNAFDLCMFAVKLSKQTDVPISVVNFSSIYGVVAPRMSGYEGTKMNVPLDYSAAKAGIIAMTKHLHRELGTTLLRFNVVSPGGIMEDQPLSFQTAYSSFTSGEGLLDSSDMIGTIVFLCSDFSRKYGGHNFILDEGFSL